MKLPSAYILSHNGLGDNVTMISAVRFLSNFYDTIYFLCRDTLSAQILYLYKLHPNIVIVPFESENHKEFSACKDILSNKYDTSDIFVCGIHKNYLPTKITHPLLLNYNKQNNYMLPDRFSFINMFYTDIGLDISIFVNYFNINIDNEIIELYDAISNYNIVFIHSTSSNVDLDMTHVINKYIHDEESIIICPNKNVYDIANNKYNIANKYVFLPTIFHYIEIIKKSSAIYVTDSCISCMVIPLMFNNLLNTKDITIYNRDTLEKIIFE
jgi:hypothetical protein